MGHNALPIVILGTTLLAICVGLPQIPSYSVHDVNAEVLDEVDNVETARNGGRFVESKVSVAFPPRPTDLLKKNLVKTEDAYVDGNTEVKYVKVQEKIEEEELSPTDVAGSIAFEVLDEVGDHLGSRGSAVKKLERLLKAARGK